MQNKKNLSSKNKNPVQTFSVPDYLFYIMLFYFVGPTEFILELTRLYSC